MAQNKNRPNSRHRQGLLRSSMLFVWQILFSLENYIFREFFSLHLIHLQSNDLCNGISSEEINLPPFYQLIHLIFLTTIHFRQLSHFLALTVAKFDLLIFFLLCLLLTEASNNAIFRYSIKLVSLIIFLGRFCIVFNSPFYCTNLIDYNRFKV